MGNGHEDHKRKFSIKSRNRIGFSKYTVAWASTGAQGTTNSCANAYISGLVHVACTYNKDGTRCISVFEMSQGKFIGTYKCTHACLSINKFKYRILQLTMGRNTIYGGKCLNCQAWPSQVDTCSQHDEIQSKKNPYGRKGGKVGYPCHTLQTGT